MQTLTDLFVSQIGKRPVSFRAGRFGAGPNTGKILIDLGYHTDTSIVPHVNHRYRGEKFFPDHSRCLEPPYFVSDDGDLTQAGSSPLLELPVTVRRIHRRFDPLGFRHDMDAWLRPSYSSYPAMTRIADKVLKESCPVMVMMFHNVEFVPGCSPYAQTEEEVRKLLSIMERFFQYCRKHDVQFATMDEVFQQIRTTPS